MKWKKDTFFLFGSFVLLWNYSCMVNLLLRESGKIREIKFWVCCVLESAAIERHKEMIFTKFLLFCIVFFPPYMGTRRQRELDAPSLGPCFIKQSFFFFLHDLILRFVIFYIETEKLNFKAMGFVHNIFVAVADMKDRPMGDPGLGHVNWLVIERVLPPSCI